MISREDGAGLLRLAKESVRTHFSNREPNTENVMHLNEKQGVFVTLHKNSELRGCIGFPEPVMPLYKAVIQASRAAAFDDIRFAPLTEMELDNITFEVSVLTKPVLIEVDKPEEYLEQIKIGRDGLIIRSDFNSGLLLPQVPVEQKWDILKYLNYICLKAGMPEESWKDLDNKLYKFQAQIFTEQ